MSIGYLSRDTRLTKLGVAYNLGDKGRVYQHPLLVIDPLVTPTRRKNLSVIRLLCAKVTRGPASDIITH